MSKNQCWGSLTFWYGSGCGFSDPHLWLTDPDVNPGGPKTYGSWFGTLVHLHHSSKIKVINSLQNSRNQGFSYYFCLMMKGSGDGSVLVTNGSGCGSRRPKNVRILRIRIRNPTQAIFFFTLPCSTAGGDDGSYSSSGTHIKNTLALHLLEVGTNYRSNNIAHFTFKTSED